MPHAVGHIATVEEYFHQQDAELIEEMRRRAAADERHRQMAEACGITDSKTLEALDRLGYDETTVTLLELVPLVQLAWIGGSVSQPEQDRLLAIAGRHGVSPNTRARQQLMAWMDQCPSEAFFQGTLGVIQAVFESLPSDQRIARRSALIRDCTGVATASCELFGWTSRACAAKQKLLGEIEQHFHAEGPVSRASANAI